MNGEKGQVLPLVLLALAIGSVVVTPFVGHAGSSLIGSRIYRQAITEQYSCDAGVEWALWRLKGNPVLTTNTVYNTASLAPFPSQINGSAFPTTEIRFVSGAGATELTTPVWLDGRGNHDYAIGTTDLGTITVVIGNITASSTVSVTLRVPGNPTRNFVGAGPYTAVFNNYSAGAYTIRVTLPRTSEYGPLGPGPITITIRYPIASYDTRAQKGDRTITVRATASYLATRVISWQVQ